jgi:hypothetical protein
MAAPGIRGVVVQQVYERPGLILEALVRPRVVTVYISLAQSLILVGTMSRSTTQPARATSIIATLA